MFLVGLATTLTKSPMIGFFDILPVYLIMGLAIIMMLVETSESLNMSLIDLLKLKFLKKR